jgi:hypothetical protein
VVIALVMTLGRESHLGFYFARPIPAQNLDLAVGLQPPGSTASRSGAAMISPASGANIAHRRTTPTRFL